MHYRSQCWLECQRTPAAASLAKNHSNDVIDTTTRLQLILIHILCLTTYAQEEQGVEVGEEAFLDTSPPNANAPPGTFISIRFGGGGTWSGRMWR